MPTQIARLRQELTALLEPSEIVDLDGDDGIGIQPRGWNWTAYTIYAKGLCFSVYAAEPNIMKGIDIEDERWVMEGSVFGVQSFLRGALNRPVPEHVLSSRMVLSEADAAKFRRRQYQLQDVVTMKCDCGGSLQMLVRATVRQRAVFYICWTCRAVSELTPSGSVKVEAV